MSDRSVTAEEIEAVLRLPVLGVIPHLERRRSLRSPNEAHIKRQLDLDGRWRSRLLTAWTADSAEAAAYQVLWTQIEHLNRDRGAILITSRTRGEGVSLTAMNLSLVAARAGRRVLLIEAELHDRRISKIFGHTKAPGLAAALERSLPLTEVSQPLEGLGVDLVPAGQIISDPSTLWRQPALPRFLTQARSLYNVVLIDAPPLSGDGQVPLLANCVDALIWVHQLGRLTLPSAKRLAPEIEPHRQRLIGVLINDSPWTPEKSFSIIPTCRS